MKKIPHTMLVAALSCLAASCSGSYDEPMKNETAEIGVTVNLDGLARTDSRSSELFDNAGKINTVFLQIYSASGSIIYSTDIPHTAGNETSVVLTIPADASQTFTIAGFAYYKPASGEAPYKISNTTVTRNNDVIITNGTGAKYSFSGTSLENATRKAVQPIYDCFLLLSAKP